MTDHQPPAQHRPSVEAEPGQETLVLSSSLLTDRMFIYGGFLSTLAAAGGVRVWATSARDPRSEGCWAGSPGIIEPFPDVRSFRMVHNYLRRFNEFAWDARQRLPSRESMTRHPRKDRRPSVRMLRGPGRVLAALRLEQLFESRLERFLTAYPRCPEATAHFRRNRPSLVFTTGPFQFDQPAIATAAKSLGIPVAALIPSWDNVTTKNRMVLDYDAYVVWSETTKRELLEVYPASRKVPIYVVGAPQFDVFFQPRFQRSRAEYCRTQGLSPERPILLYAIGSPNMLPGEKYGAVDLAERIERGELGNVQMIVRPHPIHDNAEMHQLFARFSSRIVLQQAVLPGTAGTARSQNEAQIVDWVNTFLHADVVINLASTVTVDAALFDRPVINLDYDPAPGASDQVLIKEINHVWSHFKPVAESGGVYLVNNAAELVKAITTYLATPELHREQRRWITRHVCHYLDGHSGERMAQALLDLRATRSRGST